jgi:hypothetical protein
MVATNIPREVKYHSWIANLVLVKKKNFSWRMGVDYEELNQACLKDTFPLLDIDLKIVSLASFRFKRFLDAYQGYHQIQMAP